MDKATLLMLKRERLRRIKTDGLDQWCPYPKQQLFVDSILQGKAKENWFIAGNRTGKTDAGAYVGSIMARFGPQDDNHLWDPRKGVYSAIRSYPTSGWVVALDFPMSRDIVQPKYFDNGYVPPGCTPFIPDHEIDSWSIKNQILRLKNGSIIGFKSADSKRKKFQGTEKDWIHFDEEPPYDIYKESVIRIGSRPLRVFGTCTILPPEGTVGGISWLYSDKIDPYLAGKIEDVELFGASIYDNPHLMETEIKRLESIYPEGSADRRIRLEGEWLPGMSGARAYMGFNREIHVRDQVNFYNHHKPLCWAWDFNVEPMTSIVGQMDGDMFRIFREYKLTEGNIPVMCQQFINEYGKHPGQIYIYGDATGKNRQIGAASQSCYWLILSSIPSFRNRVELRVPDSNPHVSDRINAVNRAFNGEQGEINLVIDPHCRELITDLLMVLRDKGGGIKKTTKKNDPYFLRTHFSDALGYWIHYEAPVNYLTTNTQPRAREYWKPMESPAYAIA